MNNPPAGPGAGYVFETTSDGSAHALVVTSTADLVWYEYAAPRSNAPALPDPPRRGIGRVRR